MTRYLSPESAARQASAARETALRMKLWTVPRAPMGATGLRASGQNSTKHGAYGAAVVLALAYCRAVERALLKGLP